MSWVWTSPLLPLPKEEICGSKISNCIFMYVIVLYNTFYKHHRLKRFILLNRNSKFHIFYKQLYRFLVNKYWGSLFFHEKRTEIAYFIKFLSKMSRFVAYVPKPPKSQNWDCLIFVKISVLSLMTPSKINNTMHWFRK